MHKTDVVHSLLGKLSEIEIQLFLCDIAKYMLDLEVGAGRNPDPRSYKVLEAKRLWLQNAIPDGEYEASVVEAEAASKERCCKPDYVPEVDEGAGAASYNAAFYAAWFGSTRPSLLPYVAAAYDIATYPEYIDYALKLLGAKPN